MRLTEGMNDAEMIEVFNPFELTWRSALIYTSALAALWITDASSVWWVAVMLGIVIYFIEREARRQAGVTYDLRLRVAALEHQLQNAIGPR
jgi:hypothetical protein